MSYTISSYSWEKCSPSLIQEWMCFCICICIQINQILLIWSTAGGVCHFSQWWQLWVLAKTEKLIAECYVQQSLCYRYRCTLGNLHIFPNSASALGISHWRTQISFHNYTQQFSFVLEWCIAEPSCGKREQRCNTCGLRWTKRSQILISFNSANYNPLKEWGN